MQRVAAIFHHILPGLSAMGVLLGALLRASSVDAWQWGVALLVTVYGVMQVRQGVLVWTGRAPIMVVRQSRPLGPVGSALLLTVGASLFGFLLIVLPGWNVVNALRSQSWPQVEARVTDASYGRHDCDLTYTYTVDGRAYRSERTGWETIKQGRRSDPDCNNLRGPSRPAVGDVITVAVDPGRPERAVYRTSLPRTSLFLMGWTFAIAGSVTFMVRRGHARQSA
ncbi:DUF3592 domain-containing protein [Deinococcus yunweiensis]|uniref:DUF3592 domain-containing protein n=1 Tax=Deinococcus yunweiensis TaxID=367282 RepID=UPI00398EDC60